MKNQIKIGTKIESEHKATVQFIKDYLLKNNSLPSNKEIYKHIAKDHIEGSEKEKGIPDYYDRLIKMEKQAETEMEKAFYDTLKKTGKPVPIGSTATWADGKTYKKVSDSNWEMVGGGREDGHKERHSGGSDKDDDVSTPSKLHNKFREHLESMSKEHRQIFAGGKMDFEKKKFTAPNGKVALHYSGGKVNIIKVEPMQKAFVKIMDGLFIKLEKSRPTKYISRKRVKDHWVYTYADTKGGAKGGGMLDSILSFFGFKGKEEATAKIKQTYEKHKEELGGMGFSTFTNYLSEYLKNKTKWDAKLSGAKKESSESKKESKPKGDKTPVMPHKDKKEGFSLSVMKKVAGLVNEIKSAKPEPSEGKKEGKSESKDNFETMPDKEEFTYDGYLKDKETGQRLELPNQSMANLIEKKYKEKGIDVEKIRTRQGTYVFSLKDGKTKDDLKQIQSLEEQFRNNSTQELKEMLDPDSYKTKPANYEAQMAAVRNVLKEREEDDAQNIRDKQREESIKTQGWTKTSIDKSNVKYYNGTKIDPKDIKDSFSVWGKTIAVVKNKYGSFDTIELSTGLTVSKNHDTQKKSIEIAKNALGINGKEKFLSAVNNAEKINNFDTMPESMGGENTDVVPKISDLKNADGSFKNKVSYGSIDKKNIKNPLEQKLMSQIKPKNMIKYNEKIPTFNFSDDGQKQGYWSDTVVLIMDKKISDEIYKNNFINNFLDDLKLYKKNGETEKSLSEKTTQKTINERILELREGNKKFPDVSRVIPTDASKKSANFTGKYKTNDDGKTIMEYSDGEKTVFLNADYIATIKNKFPDSTIHISQEKPMVLIKQNGENKAILAKTIVSDDIQEKLKNVQSESEVDKTPVMSDEDKKELKSLQDRITKINKEDAAVPPPIKIEIIAKLTEKINKIESKYDSKTESNINEENSEKNEEDKAVQRMKHSLRDASVEVLNELLSRPSGSLSPSSYKAVKQLLAEKTGDKSTVMSGVTGKDLNKPWEMTRDEWQKEKDALKFDTGEYGSSKLGIGKSKTGAEKNAETRKTITEALNFGMSKESDLRPLPENMARLNNRVDHADVIYKALKEGKKVPDNILSEYKNEPEFKKLLAQNKGGKSSVMFSTNYGDTLKNNVETLSKEVAKLAKDERDPKTGEMSQKYYDTLSKFNESRDKLNSFLEGKSKEKLNSPEYKAQQKTLEEAQKLKDKMKEREAAVTSSTYEKSKKRLEKQAETNMSASKRGAGAVSQGDKKSIMSESGEKEAKEIKRTEKYPDIPTFDSPPKGYKLVPGAQTAPKGYEWYYNGESRFSGKRVSVLVKDSEMKKARANQLLIEELLKAKKMPIGTVTNGRKKVAEGKWVDVSDGKDGGPKEGEEDKKDKKKDDPEKENDNEEKKGKIKEALKKMATILSETLSGKGNVTQTGQAVEEGAQQAGDSLQKKKKEEENQKRKAAEKEKAEKEKAAALKAEKEKLTNKGKSNVR